MADDTGSASPLPGSDASSTAIGTGSSFTALKTGLTIRHYIIEEVIGAGGFGITYRARHERLSSKIFALKEFFPRQFAARQGTHVVSTPDGEGLFRWGLDRFLKEAEALAKCEHPGIVDVVDYFEENGTAYAVLGYIEGRQLGQWLDELGRTPTQAELDRILMPLLDALEVVHRAKLLHRDIAPDNILIRRDGSPCLIDFGACREDIRDRSQKLSAIVKHGYSPPEQYHGIAELQGPWTDIYAVAATLYRAVSGQAPMDSSRRGTLGDSLQPLSETTASDYRPGFLAAIDSALRLKPEERPSSIAEWRAMLQSDVTDTAAATTPPAPAGWKLPSASADRPSMSADPSGVAAISPSRKTPPRASPLPSAGSRRRAPFIVAAAALALIAVGAAAWWRSLDPQRNQPAALSTSGAPSSAEVADRTDPNPSASTPADSGKSKPSSSVASPPHTSDAAAEAQTQARRQQALDINWQACRDAADQTKATACAAVIQSDDTAARRAAALHLIGTAARDAGDHDKAISDFAKSLALVPGDPQVLNDRGVAHFLRGRPGDRDAAMRDYESAIRIDPRHAEALNNRAWSLFQAGRAAEALADANRSVDATPTNGYAYDTRGQILEALGRKDEAIRDFERALSIDPTQATSRTGLARLKTPGR